MRIRVASAASGRANPLRVRASWSVVPISTIRSAPRSLRTSCLLGHEAANVDGRFR
jgi:hypothetical protein